MPSKKKNMGQDKQKKRGGEKVLKFCFPCMPQLRKLIFCSFVVSFIKLFIARQWLEDCLTSFKKHFSAKIAGGGMG